MIDRGHGLPVVRQAALLQVSRSSVYAQPQPVPPARLVIMTGSTRCIWSTLSRAAGCCATCCALRAR